MTQRKHVRIISEPMPKPTLNRYGSGNVNYKEPKRVSIGGSTSAGYRSSVRKANTKVGLVKNFLWIYLT